MTGPPWNEIAPLIGGYFLPFAGSLWHKGANNRTFPYMEAIKNQRGASKIPLWESDIMFIMGGQLELVMMLTGGDRDGTRYFLYKF